MMLARSRVGSVYYGRWAAATLALALAGCAGAETLDGAPEAASAAEQSQAFDAFIGRYVERADGSGASAAQRELLESAAQLGEVSTDLEREGLEAFFACLDDYGISHEFLGTDGTAEFPRLNYTHGPGEGGDVCYQAEFALLDEAYQTQPQATAAAEARLLEHRPALVACIRDAGGTIDDEATATELKRELWFVLMGAYADDPDAIIDPTFEGVDCLGTVGLPVSDL